jgi:ribonucleotide monophosphatase NagD (HAD superfamily)
MKKFARVFSTSSKPRLPAILSDIDGVVCRGGHEIGNSKRVIRALLNQKVQEAGTVPFALLTNGGGVPEHERAQVLNKIIGLEAQDGCRALQGDDMILCHSPFRGAHFLEKYGDKYILVSGVGRMIDICQHYGYKKAIDIEELFSLYPHLAPVT